MRKAFFFLAALALAAVCRAGNSDIASMMRPIPETACLKDPGWFIWGGSIVRDGEGTYHMFYSRWKKQYGFESWVTHSEIAHATSASPFGPFKHVDVALPARGVGYWDGMCTHNPTVHKFGDKYYLYYMGNTGDGRPSVPDMGGKLNFVHRNNQRIGVAVADTPYGPWKRLDKPVIDITADASAPDALMVSNPAVTECPDGSYLIVYKAVGKQRKLPFGGPVVHLTATSSSPAGPFTKQLKPVFLKEGVDFPAEDPYLWTQDGKYYVILKDGQASFVDTPKALALFESDDAVSWRLAAHPRINDGHTLRWESGRTDWLDRLERPQLLIEDGRLVALTLAAGKKDKKGVVVDSYNVQIPLTQVPVVAGIHNVKMSASPDRVKAPLSVDMERIGTLAQRGAAEISGGTNWMIGCEVLDRDFMSFNEYKELVPPLGIKRARLQGGWAKCEREKGKYDFSWLDRQVDFLNAHGVECCIETSYGNPIYAGGGNIDLASGFPTSEEGLAAWDRWVDALTRHFAGRVRIWLMWNEPDISPRDGSAKKTPELIASFNVRTAKIVRKNIPDAEIAGLSLASQSPVLFEQCLQCIGKDVSLFRSFIYHGYRPAPEDSYEDVEKLKELCARYAPHAVMWQGENGCPSEMGSQFALSKIPWTEYSQAKWDLRRMLGDLGHDVWSSVFTICDFNHTGREMNQKGLIRSNEEKEVVAIKRAYYSVQNVASVFDSTVKRVKGSCWGNGFGCFDKNILTYEYVKDSGEPVFVFWRAKKDIKTFERPGDSFDTAPMTFRYTGKPLKEPVWVDLLTGRIYSYPIENQCVSDKSIRFIDVPVYDSPCILTERSAVYSQ